jgi:hypothetical protein
LKACSVNASLITVSGNGSKLSGLTLIGNGGNTSGFAIKITGNENRIENNHVNGFCTYLYNIGRHNIIDANVFTDNINPTDSHTCDALIDGDATAQTIGSIYTKNLFTAWGPSAAGAYHSGMLFQNSGGSYVAFNDIQRTGYGTMIKPLANKTTSFLLFDTTVLGDTTNADALIIDTAAASSKVEVINISNSYMGRNGDWPGTFTWASARNVTIQNSGAGLVLGVHIKGTQFNTTGNENLAIAGPVNDITVDNSMLCFPGQGVNSSNVTINTAGTIALRNNTIAAACDGTTFNGTTTNSNIHFLTNDPDNINITGNQFYGVWQSGNGPIDDAVSPVNTSALVMANNLPYDTVPLTLASAAVLQPLYYSQVIVTGVVGVTNIRHPWRGRTIQFYVQDGLTFTAGGGGTDPICANKAIAAGILATARFQAGPNCWAIQ